MIRKTLRLAAVGFVLGMAIGNIIAIVTTYMDGGQALVFSQKLLAMAGSPALAMTMQTFFSGVLGAIAMGGVILYDVDRLPMPLICLFHYGLIILAYLPIALALGWIRPDPVSIGIAVLAEAAGYAIVWLIMFLRYRAAVRKMNELLPKREEAQATI